MWPRARRARRLPRAAARRPGGARRGPREGAPRRSPLRRSGGRSRDACPVRRPRRGRAGRRRGVLLRVRARPHGPPARGRRLRRARTPSAPARLPTGRGAPVGEARSVQPRAGRPWSPSPPHRRSARSPHHAERRRARAGTTGCRRWLGDRRPRTRRRSPHRACCGPPLRRPSRSALADGGPRPPDRRRAHATVVRLRDPGPARRPRAVPAAPRGASTGRRGTAGRRGRPSGRRRPPAGAAPGR